MKSRNNILTSMLAPLAVACISIAAPASADVVRVSASNFKASAGLVTFSNFGAVNPTYNPSDYGGGAGAPVVRTGGYFVGQSLSVNPGADCPGGAATACVVGTPTGSLSLDPDAPDVFVTGDGANPTSPVLSGSPTFNGPIAVLFSEDQFGVGFDGGFFNAVGSTGITAFARDGTLLGTISNTGTGIEFLGLVTTGPVAQIAGVFLDLVGAEPAGFAIDNLRFGERGDIEPPVPEPATWGMMILGVGMIGIAIRRRRARGDETSGVRPQALLA